MFNNAAHALEWAYNTSAKPIVKMSGINHMRESHMCGIPNGLLIGLSTQDRHQQAAQIIGMTSYLSDLAGVEYIAAYYGRRLERLDMRVLVYRGCGALDGSLRRQEAVYRIMRGYFDGRMSQRTAKKVLCSGANYATMAISCLYDVLELVHDRAMAEMDDILGRHGLIRVAGEYAIG